MIFVKKIVIYLIVKYTNDYTYYVRAIWKKLEEQKLVASFKKKFIIFLKNTNKLIVILNFSEETASSRDALKFLKRMTYIVINIHNFRPPGWLYSPVRMRNSS